MFCLAATRGKTEERREEKIADKEIKEIGDKEKVKRSRTCGRGRRGRGAGLVTRKTGKGGRSLGEARGSTLSVSRLGFDITLIPVPHRMWPIDRACPIKATGAQRFTTLALELISSKNK